MYSYDQVESMFAVLYMHSLSVICTCRDSLKMPFKGYANSPIVYLDPLTYEEELSDSTYVCIHLQNTRFSCWVFLH